MWLLQKVAFTLCQQGRTLLIRHVGRKNIVLQQRLSRVPSLMRPPLNIRLSSFHSLTIDIPITPRASMLEVAVKTMEVSTRVARQAKTFSSGHPLQIIAI